MKYKNVICATDDMLQVSFSNKEINIFNSKFCGDKKKIKKYSTKQKDLIHCLNIC